MNRTQKDFTMGLIKQMSDKRERIDAMTLTRKYNQLTGERVDWHEFSSFLDMLYNQKYLKIVQPGGWMVYDLNV